MLDQQKHQFRFFAISIKKEMLLVTTSSKTQLLVLNLLTTCSGRGFHRNFYNSRC
nr:MAG TPA: hypothetical protein [Caudoviricetes sp.]